MGMKPEDVKLASTYQKPGEDTQGLRLSNNPHTLRAKINVLFKKRSMHLIFLKNIFGKTEEKISHQYICCQGKIPKL